MSARRSRPDPVLSAYVQARLDALLPPSAAQRTLGAEPDDAHSRSDSAHSPSDGVHSVPDDSQFLPAEAEILPRRALRGHRQNAVAADRAAAAQPPVDQPPPFDQPPDDRLPPIDRPPLTDQSPVDQPTGLHRLRAGLGDVAGKVPEFVRGHAVVIGVILVVAVMIGGYFVLTTRTTSVAVAMPTPAGSSASEPTPSASPTPTPQRIQVHVLGAVTRPGVVSLPAGARVHEAIAAAGGLLPRADPGQLNLAAVVTDGAQIVIGTKGSPRGEVSQSAPPTPGSSPGSSPGTGQRLDLNAATAQELEQLPGVGPVTAKRIVEWREQHGRFASVEQLQEVSGIGPKTYAEIAPHVRV